MAKTTKKDQFLSQNRQNPILTPFKIWFDK